MADPDDTGGGGRATDYGPTSAVARATSRAGSAIERDDEATDIQPTPRPRLSALSRVSTPLPAEVRFMLALTEGSPVGEYEIQAQIGEGAMGTVYSAVQPLIGKTVAIKVLKPELCANQASIDRFVQEAQAVNRIGHPNIVDVFSLGELPDGRAYFVMEWLRGEDLKTRLGKGPISVDDTCEILTCISRALEAAHGKDIVHRDLKPDNVFLHQVDNGPIMVKLLDFGIAKLMREKATMEKTATGNMLGTPRYISPEQARGIDVTHRADIYSLGVMAYEMLAGRAPFIGETAMDLVVKHLHEPPSPLSQFVRVPRPLERCVMSMLAKDPADRPTLAAVRRVLAAPTLSQSALSLPKVVPTGSSRRWWVAVLAALLVGGGVFAAIKLSRGDDAEPIANAPTESPQPAVAPPNPEPEPKAPKPAVGTLAVSVEGAKDATIFVDGAEWGKSNETQIQMLDLGEHEVVAQVKGKPVATQKVTVTATEVTKVTLVVPVAKVAVKRPPARPPVRRPTPQKEQGDLLTPKGMRK